MHVGNAVMPLCLLYSLPSLGNIIVACAYSLQLSRRLVLVDYARTVLAVNGGFTLTIPRRSAPDVIVQSLVGLGCLDHRTLPRESER